MFSHNNNNNIPSYQGMQYDRIQYELMENRRKMYNLAKRLSRIESYLRIKDVNDDTYAIEKGPNDFSF